jgi:hypothetical protein
MRIVSLVAVLTPAALLLAGATNAPAQQACVAPAEPWHAARALPAARDRSGLAATRFAPGEAVRFALHPDGEVAYLTLPKGAGEEKSFGGVAAFTVTEPGLYRVGLSEPVWVDVVANGVPAESVKFGPGPECSGIRKAVSFRLSAGEHVLEMSGGTEPGLGVVIERVAE